MNTTAQTPAPGPAPAPPNEETCRVLQLLGKDHLGPEVIDRLAALDGVGPLLGRIVTGSQPAGDYERENAIYALGMIGADAAVPDLAHVLWQGEPDSQLLAARALGRIGNPAALAELRRLYHGTAAADLTAPQPDREPGAPRFAWNAGAPRVAETGGAWHNAAQATGNPQAGMPVSVRPLPSAVALELRDILAR